MKTPGQEDAQISITVLEKSFQVRCPAESVNDLRSAAEHLDHEMHKMRRAGVVGLDRLAVIAALNISHELLHAQKQRDDYVKSTSHRIRELQTRIDEALTTAEQLEFNDVSSSE